MTTKKTAHIPSFTLIEMLIVLAMITVILGVLVSMLNPKAQFDKARDRTIEGVMAKMVLAINSYRNVYDAFPDYNKFVESGNEIEGTEIDTGDGTSDAESFVVFTVPGVSNPSSCTGNNWSGDGTDQCYFYYNSTDGCVVAKSWRDSSMYYRYDLGESPTIEYVDSTGISNCGT
jgi:type II secretory pathway pseudopilin PulG